MMAAILIAMVVLTLIAPRLVRTLFSALFMSLACLVLLVVGAVFIVFTFLPLLF